MKNNFKFLLHFCFVFLLCFFATVVVTNASEAPESEAYLKGICFNSDSYVITDDDAEETSDENYILTYYFNNLDKRVYSVQILKRANIDVVPIYSEGATCKVDGEPYDPSNVPNFNSRSSGWTTIEITSQDGTNTNTYYILHVGDLKEWTKLQFCYWNFIPEPDAVNSGDKGILEVIKEQYTALDENKQEAEVIQKINDGLAKIYENEAEEFTAKVAVLKGDGTDTDEAIAAAKDAYETLSDEAKALVTDSKATLDAAEKAVEDKKTADAFAEQIKALKGDGTDTDEAIAAAKAAYEALSPEAKELAKADNDKLTAAEKAVADKKAADDAAKATTEAPKPTTQPSTQAPAATVPVVQKGTSFKVGKNNYKVTKVSGKSGNVTFTKATSKKLSKVIIPATVNYKGYTFKVTEIAKNALKNNKKLTTVTVGKNVTTIGASAFAGDAKLKKITVKSTVLKKVGAKSLKGIHKKAVIKVPKKQLKKYTKLFKGKGQKKTVKVKK